LECRYAHTREHYQLAARQQVMQQNMRERLAPRQVQEARQQSPQIAPIAPLQRLPDASSTVPGGTDVLAAIGQSGAEDEDEEAM
jgi:hypothetical protein